MAYQAKNVQLSFAGEKKILPVTDSAYLDHVAFKEKFGEDGNVMVVGVKTDKLFSETFFNAWRKLCEDIEHVEGVENVLSISQVFDLVKDTAQKRYQLVPLVSPGDKTQSEIDSIYNRFNELPFYKGIIINEDQNASLIAINFSPSSNTIETRTAQIEAIGIICKSFESQYNIKLHFSGLPYIRTVISQKIVYEFQLFFGLAILITSLILLFFFRSIYAVIFTLIVVALGAVWSVGLITLFGYKITVLSGLVAPLVIVIGVPNSILLLNKYLNEYKKWGNKIDSFKATIEQVSISTFIANLTTAIGFGVFYFTDSELLVEFGVIAAIGVMITWLISLVLIPIIFSYLPPPNERNNKNLDSEFLKGIINHLDNWSRNHRKAIYGIAIGLSIISIIGITQIKVDGYMIDDLPEKDQVYTDLTFFEQNFGGVLPLEIEINTNKEGAVTSLKTLNLINKLEKVFAEYPEFSKPLSLVEVLKFSTQAFYNGSPAFYKFPNSMERNFVLAYAANNSNEGKSSRLVNAFVDSNKMITRVSYQVPDLGSLRMNALMKDLRPQIDSLFADSGYDVKLTGASVVFLKGNNYLIKNLRESLILAIVLVSLIMLILFKTPRMILISLLPNLIPLAITAALMGYTGINLKPSTVLIFSIALGLASDQTIYFLTKYRYEKRMHNWGITKTVSVALRETGVSMMYTAIVLFSGFSIFLASNFGGTILLGLLISFTVLMAILFNLTLLPALLIGMDSDNDEE
jgi:uncharacterized protein